MQALQHILRTMEISFADLKEKEVVNILDGKKLGRIIDITFDGASGQVLGIVLPGIKKFMRKSEDIFVPISNLKKIGEDVLLVKLSDEEEQKKTDANIELKPYLKYKRSIKKET